MNHVNIVIIYNDKEKNFITSNKLYLMCFEIAIGILCVYLVCMQCINRHIIIRVCLVKYVAAVLHVHSQCVMTTRMTNSSLYVFNKKEPIKDFLKRFEFKC